MNPDPRGDYLNCPETIWLELGTLQLNSQGKGKYSPLSSSPFATATGLAFPSLWSTRKEDSRQSAPPTAVPIGSCKVRLCPALYQSVYTHGGGGAMPYVPHSHLRWFRQTSTVVNWCLLALAKGGCGRLLLLTLSLPSWVRTPPPFSQSLKMTRVLVAVPSPAAHANYRGPRSRGTCFPLERTDGQPPV